MKKIICLLVCLFIGIPQCYAYYDIDNNNLEECIEELSKFNIINGYEDGSFRPDNNVTRAEFSKIIMKTIFTDTSIDTAGTFTDIDESYWAATYIYSAKALGIVNGINQYEFSPESNITYEQAIKMIVSAIGYSDMAEINGGYPNGYVNAAEELNITDNISFNQTDYATRGNIALLIGNTLRLNCYCLINDNGTINKQFIDVPLYQLHENIYTMVNNEPVQDNNYQSSNEAVG